MKKELCEFLIRKLETRFAKIEKEEYYLSYSGGKIRTYCIGL